MAKLLTAIVRHVERQARLHHKEAQREERRLHQEELREAKREAKLRQKELARELKERDRLSALELARLEVDAFENGIDVLLSIHKDAAAPVDWHALAATLLPCEPANLGESEFEATLIGAAGEPDAANIAATLEAGRRLDAEAHASFLATWQDECRRLERERVLARRVLARELGAYVEAITEFSGLGEVEQLGSAFEVTAHSAKLVECRLVVNGWDVIPRQVLSLTSSGKTTLKNMPTARFYELYQDHVCSCVLRVAREVLAVLPIDVVLVTASAQAQSGATTSRSAIPILSAAFPRPKLQGLPFDTLDPSDAMESFLRRGDVRASRKSGEFKPIVPLQPKDLDPPPSSQQVDLAIALAAARAARSEMQALRATFTQAS